MGNEADLPNLSHPAPVEETCAGLSLLEMASMEAVLLAATPVVLQLSLDCVPGSELSESVPESEPPDCALGSRSLEFVPDSAQLYEFILPKSFLSGSYTHTAGHLNFLLRSYGPTM